MSYLDVSTDAELEPIALVLTELQRRAAACHVGFMVVGATARDILIRSTLESAPERATADVDIAVAVGSWQDVDCVTADLERAPRRGDHAFRVLDVLVDVIPFGAIETDTREISWTSDHRMNVFGFNEAYASSLSAKLPGDLTVAVASLAAQSLLKLLAWRDRRHEDIRDAIDLKTILNAYHQGPYADDLYTSEFEPMLVEQDYDVVLAGAQRLGWEARGILRPGAAEPLTALLSDESMVAALAGGMGGVISGNRALLKAYRRGYTSARMSTPEGQSGAGPLDSFTRKDRSPQSGRCFWPNEEE